jgi:transposase InsO family protein
MDRQFGWAYSGLGRPSTPPPEQLLKALLLQALYSVRSEGGGIGGPSHSNESQRRREMTAGLVGLCAVRGRPERLVSDNGPEFTGQAVDSWACQRGVQRQFIEPGKPVQNAYVESFNGKFRDECLNEHWFDQLDHARAVVEGWRQDYNECRPHSALGRSKEPPNGRRKRPSGFCHSDNHASI